MKILKNVHWTWWEIGLVKWSSLLCGIAVGAYWSAIFAPYELTIVTAGLLLGLIALHRWLKK